MVSALTTHLRDLGPRGDLVHHVQQHRLHDGAQAARAGLELDGLVGRGLQRVGREDQLDVVQAEQALVLLDQGVARLGQDAHQGGLVQRVDADA